MALGIETQIVMDEARRAAVSIWRKFPPAARRVQDIDDVQQDILAAYYGSRAASADRRFNGKATDAGRYVYAILYRCGLTLLTRVWERKEDEEHAFSFQHDLCDGGCYVPERDAGGDWMVSEGMGVLYAGDPETLFIDAQEEYIMSENITLLSSEVKGYCRYFHVRYNPEHPLASLGRVLDLTLNRMTGEDFAKLEVKVQDRLAELGAYYERHGLDVHVGTDNRLKSKGLAATVREALDAGLHDNNQIRAYLAKHDVIYNKRSLLTIIYNEKTARGLPTGRRATIKGAVEELWREGVRDVREMFARLRERRVRFKEITVRIAVSELRKAEGAVPD